MIIAKMVLVTIGVTELKEAAENFDYTYLPSDYTYLFYE